MNQGELVKRLQARLQALEDRIGAACRRSGRPRQAVRLVAVTKTISATIAALLPELGVLDLGENRPQELWHKAGAISREVRWHLIGHLQRNKVERTLPLVSMIHSVDSERLLEALEHEAAKRGQAVAVLLEVNASREANKHGFAPDELAGLTPRIQALHHLQVQGLMTMAALEESPEASRPTFRLLRQLRDRLRPELPPPHRLEHLSMGMTNDFEIAIEEGATLVRIGSALFEGLTEPGE
jgi:pyridoxal phosphate enzyme (YggS family)